MTELSTGAWIAEQIRKGLFSNPSPEPRPKTESEKLSMGAWIAQQIREGRLFPKSESTSDQEESKI